MDILFVAQIAFLASGLTLFSGFGLGTILMPAFELLMPVEVAIGATAVVHLANNLFKLGLVGRQADLGVLVRFAVPAALAAILGASLLVLLTDLPTVTTWTAFGTERRVEALPLAIGSLIVIFALLELSPAFARLSFPRRFLPLGVSFQQVVHPVRTDGAGVATLQSFREDRMNSHENARLTALGRAELVRRVIDLGQPASQVAASFGVCVRTVRKWVARFEAEGEAGMRDRSSRPHKLYRPTPDEVADRIAALRRERWTGKRIAAELGVSPATVSRVLRRLGLSRMRDLEPAEPVRRYEPARPGEMIHIDIKKLGRFERVGHRITGDRRGQSNSRGVGWEYVHVCVDDHSRLAFASIFPDEKAVSAIAFLRAAIRFYAGLGVTVERVMTDNGSCYKSYAFRDACKALGLRHIRTKPYTPKTNGKAERFIKTALDEWAYARAYQTSDQRAAHLPEWTHSYNWHRPHGGIGSQRPISRLGLTGDIRRPLVSGAMAVIRWALRRGAPRNPWLARMLERKPPMVAAFALANKMARGIWAMLTRGEDYRDPAIANAA